MMRHKGIRSTLAISASIMAVLSGYYAGTSGMAQARPQKATIHEAYNAAVAIPTTAARETSIVTTEDEGGRKVTYDPQKKLSDISIHEPNDTKALLELIDKAITGSEETMFISYDNLDFDGMDDLCHGWTYIFDTDMGFEGKDYYSNYESDRDPKYYGYIIGEGPDGNRWYFDFDEETLSTVPVAPVAGTYDERSDRKDWFWVYCMQRISGRDYVSVQRRSHAEAKRAASLCNGATEIDTMNAIVDYVHGTVSYADDVVEAIFVGGDKPTDHWKVFDAYGALVERHAVCEGMAYATGMIARYCGIPCVTVFTERHAWNAFMTSDGSVYMADPTNGRHAYAPTDWPSNELCTKQYVYDWLRLKCLLIEGSVLPDGDAMDGSTGEPTADVGEEATDTPDIGGDDGSYEDDKENMPGDVSGNIVIVDEEVRPSTEGREMAGTSPANIEGQTNDVDKRVRDNSPYTVTNGASSVTAGRGRIEVSFVDRQEGLTYNVRIRSALIMPYWSTYTSTSPDMTITGLGKGQYEVSVRANSYHDGNLTDNGWTYPLVVSVQ